MASATRWDGGRLVSHGVALGLGALAALAITGADAASPPRDRLAALDAFAQVLSLIQTDYVAAKDERDLLYGGIRGMLARLDRHSVFYGPAAYRRLREDTEGEFGGLGCELAAPAAAGTDYPVLERVVAGGPAARAGLVDGDRVHAIDGHDTRAGQPRQLSRLLRGPRGSRVELVVDGAGGRRRLALVREQIHVPTVSQRGLTRRVGYLKLGRFNEATAADCEAAIGQLGRAPGGLAVLVLDLRGNPGGVFEQAIRVADHFLDGGVIVTARSRGVEIERHVAHRGGPFEAARMIALIDQSTASSAELVAAALADHHRATLVGVQSFGKGSVQTFFDLADGSGMKLTTALYYTPAGRSLDGHGLVPDQVVEAFAAEVISAGPGDPAAAAGSAGAHIMKGLEPEVAALVEDDPQLGAALAIALGWLGGPDPTVQLPARERTSAP